MGPTGLFYYCKLDKFICHVTGVCFSYLSLRITKPTKWPGAQRIQISHPVWSDSSLSAYRNLGTLATHWVHSEDSDQTGRMPRLIWVLAGLTGLLLVLSCCGSKYCHIFTEILVFNANSDDFDQLSLSVAADLGSHCLPRSFLWNARY